MHGAELEESRYGTLLRLASSTRAGGDPAAAVNIYQQAIALDRDRLDAYVLLGDTLIELKQYDDAAKTYEEALRRNSDNAAAHRGYARAMLGLNRPEAAIVHYQAVIKRTRTTSRRTTGSGWPTISPVSTRPPQAAYRAGLEVAPDSMLLRNNLGLSLALAGHYKEAIELLRALADEPGANARNRQNLALAYGLSGDLVAAERVSRLDLDEEAVQNNLAYFAALAAVDDERKRAAAIGVHAPELTDHAADAGTSKRLGAIALEGQGLELGLAPTGRWFLNLGNYASSQQAASAWRHLRAQHGDVLAQLTRLAGVQDGRQPLLVGPLTDASQAQSACGTLRKRGQSCDSVPL